MRSPSSRALSWPRSGRLRPGAMHQAGPGPGRPPPSSTVCSSPTRPAANRVRREMLETRWSCPGSGRPGEGIRALCLPMPGRRGRLGATGPFRAGGVCSRPTSGQLRLAWLMGCCRSLSQGPMGPEMVADSAAADALRALGRVGDRIATGSGAGAGGPDLWPLLGEAIA